MTTSEPWAIDPPDCGCTDCLIGESVPLSGASDELIRRMIRGEVTDRTGGRWTVATRVVFECGEIVRSWPCPN